MQQLKQQKNIQPPSRSNNWNQKQVTVNQNVREIDAKANNNYEYDDEYYEDEEIEQYEEEDGFNHEQINQNKKENSNNSNKNNSNKNSNLSPKKSTITSIVETSQYHYQHQDQQQGHNQSQSQHQYNKSILTPSAPSKQQLLSISFQNKQQIALIKQAIAQHRQQLKKIGQLVDDNLQKSMLELNVINQKQKSVNIKELFSERIDKNQPQKIRKLRQQLSVIRKENLMTKQQIGKQNDLVNDPVNKQNFYKQQQLLSQLKILNSEFTNRKKQAIIMKDQLNRIKQSANLQQVELTEKLIHENQQLLTKINNQIKQEKSKSYKLEKEDIFLMEKIKFLKERTEQQGDSPATKETREKLVKEMRLEITNFIQEINDILQQRNKVEIQKSKQLRQLNAEIENYEQRNLQLVAELRSIESYLLQHYSQQKHQQLQQQRLQSLSRVTKTADKNNTTLKQLQRKSNNPNNSRLSRSKGQSEKTQNNSGFSSVAGGKQGDYLENVNSNSLMMREQKEVIIGSNGDDKNINPPINKFRTKVSSNNNHHSNKPSKTQSMVNTEQQHPERHIQSSKLQQKEKYFLQIKTTNQSQKQKLTYTFGDMKIDDKGAILSDQILGLVKIREITFLVDDDNCYGMSCKYVKTDDGKQVNGIKIYEKNAQQTTKRVSLQVKENQWIETIKIGCSLGKNEIKYIEVVKNNSNNNNSKQLKWRAKSQQQTVKMSELKLDKYSLMFIKGKLVSSEEVHAVSKSLNELSNIKPKLKLGGFAVNCVVNHK